MYITQALAIIFLLNSCYIHIALSDLVLCTVTYHRRSLFCFLLRNYPDGSAVNLATDFMTEHAIGY